MARRLEEKIQKFYTQYEKDSKSSEWYYAGQDVKESASSIANGITRLQNGDRLGGAASVLEGIGQLTNLATFAGLPGAVFGGILSAITGIISAILEALNPEKDSLEARIEKIITDNTLKVAKVALAGSESTWISQGEILISSLADTRDAAVEVLGKPAGEWPTQEQFEKNGYFIPDTYVTEIRDKLLTWDEAIKNMAGGFSWEYLEAHTHYQSHLQDINAGFETLKTYKENYSIEWIALFDQLMGYMFRMYISLQGLAGLVDPSGIQMFKKMQNDVAKQFRDGLDEVIFVAQDMPEIYGLWHTAGIIYYSISSTQSFQSLMWGMGLSQPTPARMEDVGAKCTSFGISSRGTIFISAAYLTPMAGRRGIGWGAAGPEKLECEQIFIGELPESETVIVACTHSNGYKLSICSFNDAEGESWEDSPNKWTPNEARWGTWSHYEYPFKIIAVGIHALDNKYYKVYALGINEDKSVTLYDLINGSPLAVTLFHWDASTVEKEFSQHDLWFYGPVRTTWHWKGPYPCAISCKPGGFLAAQLGSLVTIRDDAGIAYWDLRSPGMLWDADLNCRQARFFSDGTFVMMSNKGLHMMYWNPKKDGVNWAHNPAFESTYFLKIPAREAELMRTLYDNINRLLPNDNALEESSSAHPKE